MNEDEAVLEVHLEFIEVERTEIEIGPLEGYEVETQLLEFLVDSLGNFRRPWAKKLGIVTYSDANTRFIKVTNPNTVGKVRIEIAIGELEQIPFDSGRQERARNLVESLRSKYGQFGAISFTIEVEPKIGWHHFLALYIFASSPEQSFPTSYVDAGEVFTEFPVLLALRFLECLDTELSKGLFRGYSEIFDAELPVLRGSLKVEKFALNMALGQVRFVCDFEDFDFDTPINRVLKAAIGKSIEVLMGALNRADQGGVYDSRIFEARKWIELEFDGVSDFRESDLLHTVPVHQESIRSSFELARQLLQNLELVPIHKTQKMSGFVISQAQTYVEAALISIAKFVLTESQECLVFSLSSKNPSQVELNRFKRTIQSVPAPWTRQGLNPTSMSGDTKWSFQPDLCVHNSSPDGRHIVGDVKYTLSEEGAIKDSERYQILYFMAVYGINHGLLMNFTKSPSRLGLRNGLYVIPPSNFEPPTWMGISDEDREVNKSSDVSRGLYIQVVTWNASTDKPHDAYREFCKKLRDAQSGLLELA